MPRPRSDEELETLRAQAVAIDRRIKEVAARNKVKRDEQDRRRWLLAGRLALERMEAEPESPFAADLLKLISEHVQSQSDRKLFGLGASPAPSEPI